MLPSESTIPKWIGKKRGKRKPYIRITEKEKTILSQLGHAEIKVIADRLGIDEITVRSHISIIRKKVKDAKAFLQQIKNYERVLRKE